MATTQTSTQTQSGYPVDNNTYDLLQTLTSKLESIEAYKKYLKDADSQTRPLFEQLMKDDSEHVRKLLDTLKQELR